MSEQEHSCTCHCGGSMFYRHLHAEDCPLAVHGEEAPRSKDYEAAYAAGRVAGLREAAEIVSKRQGWHGELIAKQIAQTAVLKGLSMAEEALDIPQPRRGRTLQPMERHMNNANFNFSRALEEIKSGRKVARSGWNGKNMFIFLVPGSTFKVNRPPLLGIYPEGAEINYCPHIDMRTADGKIVPWLASQTDVLAEDWGIVE